MVSGGCGAQTSDKFEDFDHDRIVEITSESTCVTLVAGKKRNVGSVCSQIDNTVDTSAHCGDGSTGVMNITYETTGPWELVKTHLAIGKGLEDIPTNRRGRARLNQFAYIDDSLEGMTAHTVTVPLCELGLDGADEVCDPLKAHIVARAKVRRQRNNGSWRYKRAWGDGEALSHCRRQGKFFTMELACSDNPEPPPPPLAECETAFAYSPASTCFLGADIDNDGEDDGFAGWGWSIGPVAPNTTTQWPVYAAAGGCDPTGGMHVGNLAIAYDGSTATVAFEHVGEVTLDEEQIYIGNQPLALNDEGEFTINPADFPLAFDLEGATQSVHTVSDLSGDIHVVYHAVACGQGLAPDPDPLSVLTDEFDADNLSTWNVHNDYAASVSVDEGELVIVPEANTWWYAGDEAVHVSKSVTGNFSMTARMEVTDLNGGTTAPGDPYRIGGILVRDPASTEPNTYHMGIGNMNQPEVVTVSKSTDDGYSEIGTTPWGGTMAEMRICRFDDKVLAFIRLQDKAWTMVDSRLRPDLPATISAGPMAYAGTEIPDLVATTDWVDYQSVATVEDCWRD